MLRIGLFLATNLAVMIVLGVVMSLLSAWFGVSPGSNAGMLVYAAIFGFVGAFISLFASKSIAIRSMNVQLIDSPAGATEQWLKQTVEAQAQAAGIGMPDVGVFDSAQPNAFATGWNRNNSLVAVSTGLLHAMSREEVEAVLAHEVSHVANGDMVTMTLLQGVMNTFVFFVATIIGRIVDRAVFKNESGHGFGFFIVRSIAIVALGFLANLIVMWFSRRREFRADEGGAKLAGRQNMIAALERLKGGQADRAEMPTELAAFGISSSSLKKWGTTHPPLDDRIAALRKLK